MSVIPALAVLSATSVALRTLRNRAVPPSVVALGLAVLAVLGTGLTLVVLSGLTLAATDRMTLVGGSLGWCRHVGDLVPFWLGVVAATALCRYTWVATKLTLSRLRRRPDVSKGALVVVPTPTVLAYSVSGRGGQIVVSAGLLDNLDRQECRVVFAHEEAHLRCHHHQLLWLAQLAGATVWLRPLERRLVFSLERWADEVAARRVGDRALVARTLVRVALMPAARGAPGLAMARAAVRERVAALQGGAEGGTPRRRDRAAVGMFGVMAAGLIGQVPWLVGSAVAWCA